MLTNRCCSILMMVLKSDAPVSFFELSKEYLVSERSIRYDMDEIDYFIKYSGFKPLIKSVAGVFCDYNSKEKAKIVELIKELRKSEQYYLPQERLINIIVNLIKADGYVILNNEAERLNLSKTTIFKDFEKVKLLLNKEQAFLDISVMGFKLVGDEEKLRVSLAKTLLFMFDSNDIIEIINFVSATQMSMSISSLGGFFDGADIDRLRTALDYLSNSQHKPGTDTSFVYLVILFLVSMLRCEHGNIITAKKKAEVSNLGKFISSIITGSDAHDGENAFFTELLNKVPYHEQKDLVFFADLQLMACNFISAVQKSCKIAIPSSAQLISSVLEEIYLLGEGDFINTSLDKFSIKNISLELNSEIFDAINKEALVIEKYINRKLSDFELIKLYNAFEGVVSEQENSLKGKKTVIILSPFSINTVKLIGDKLRSLFDADFIELHSYKDIENILENVKIDLVVTTVSININGVNVLKVSENITKQQIQSIKKLLPSRVVDSKILFDIKEVLKDNVAPENLNKVIDKVALILNLRPQYFSANQYTDVIDSSKVLLNYPASNWIDGIIKCSEMLLKAGHIREEYIDNVIADVENARLHMSVGDGIVLAHSRRLDYVNSMGVSILRTTKPVKFIGDNDDSCDVIFCICPIDDKAHLDIISGISKVLMDENKLKILKTSKDVNEIVALFNQ